MSWRSVWAVVAGILAAIVLTLLIDFLLHTTGVYPAAGTPLSNGLAGLATAYRVAIGIGGAWLTARLAPSRPMLHAMVAGAIGAVVALVGVVVTWNSNLGPHWYGIALAVLALPQSWLGARLVEMRGARSLTVVDAS